MRGDEPLDGPTTRFWYNAIQKENFQPIDLIKATGALFDNTVLRPNTITLPIILQACRKERAERITREHRQYKQAPAKTINEFLDHGAQTEKNPFVLTVIKNTTDLLAERIDRKTWLDRQVAAHIRHSVKLHLKVLCKRDLEYIKTNHPRLFELELIR